jgi:predicted CXXCH cytochrome family protein
MFSSSRIKGGEMMRRALFLVVMVTLMVWALSAIAQAADPSVIDPSNGASLWTYKDGHDSTAKPEGGYAPFNSGSGSTGKYNNPHGGYDLTSNKCKVCHAVHRAEGAFYLLRSDSEDDVCNYCHVDNPAHSGMTVYPSSSGGTAASNGHTIGASSVIPGSSVNIWTTTETISSVDENGNPVSEDIAVRAYDPNRNKMFRFARHHGQSAAGTGRSGFKRIGPVSLSCMSCHQQHAASSMVWQPTDFYNPATKVGNYNLLKSSPSGSIWGTGSGGQNYDAGMANFTAYLGTTTTDTVDATHTIEVPETTMTASNTGVDSNGIRHTIYNTYTGMPSVATSMAPQTINQFALSAWCADCHNLEIGYTKEVQAELGFKSHADRTHPSPYYGGNTSNGPGQCYSCHRNDLPYDPGTANSSGNWTGNGTCQTCHFGTVSYSNSHTTSQFPHSGSANSVKLLGPATAYMDSNGVVQRNGNGTVDEAHIDSVCLRCHSGIGTNH